MKGILFYIFSVFVVVFSILVVTRKNVVHSALCLLFTFIGTACIFLILNAEFLAAIQIFIYAGAIVVLIVIVIMLVHLQREENIFGRHGKKRPIFASIVISFFCIGLILIASFALDDIQVPEIEPYPTTIKDLGRSMFAKFLLPFEIVSFILLVAIIGAIALGSGGTVTQMRGRKSEQGTEEEKIVEGEHDTN